MVDVFIVLMEFEFIEFEELVIIFIILLFLSYLFVGISEDIFFINFVVIEIVDGVSVLMLMKIGG